MSLYTRLIRLAIRRSKQADADVLSFAAGKFRREVNSESLQKALSKFRKFNPPTVRNFSLKFSKTSSGLRYSLDVTVGNSALPPQMAGAESRVERMVLDIIHLWVRGLPGEGSPSIRLRKSWPLITFQLTGEI